VTLPLLTQLQYEWVYASLPDPAAWRGSNTRIVKLPDSSTSVKCVLVKTRDGQSWRWMMLAEMQPRTSGGADGR